MATRKTRRNSSPGGRSRRLVLARGDALPILQAMTSARKLLRASLHLRMGGTTAGIFDVFFDTNGAEQISVAQASFINSACVL